MPRAEHDPTVVSGLREHLIATARANVVKLESAEPDLYDFSPDLRCQRQRVDELLDGADVLVYRFEIPRELQPPRDDGQHAYRLRGDRLVGVPTWRQGHPRPRETTD